MNGRDVLKASMDMAEMLLRTYLGDLSDADLLVRPGPGCNSIAWQLGHLISSERHLLAKVAPSAAVELPAGFAEAHSKTTAASNDTSKFLTKQGYLELFERVRAATKQSLDKITDADLDRDGPEEFKQMFPKVGGVYNLIASHITMHVGQWVVVRRQLGKPVVI